MTAPSLPSSRPSARPAARPTTRSAVPARYLLSRLELEWRRLADRPDAVARARAWGVVPAHEVASLDDLLRLSGLTPRRVPAAVDADPDADVAADVADPGAADEVLRQLVLLARDDSLAARVVLQRIVPGLSAIARRRSQAVHVDVFDVIDELLSAAWTVVRTFPADRRSRYVAANLLRDCEYHAFRRGTRRLLVHELTDPAALGRVDPGEGAGPRPEPLAELLDLVRSARRRYLGEGELRLLGVLLTSASTREAAERLEVSERTVRNHRAAVVRLLRRAAA